MRKMSMVLLSAAFSQDWVADPESDFEVSLNDTSDGCIITTYTGSDRDVVIPSKIQGYPVKGIGDGAFYKCRSLASVTIPNGVTKIGVEAFCKCRSLVSITIPDGVTEIGKWTFKDCSSLVSVVIPEGVTQIGVSAFHGCSNLASIAIPDSVMKIGIVAFKDCSSLVTVDIAPHNRKWGMGNYPSFYGCSKVSLASQAALKNAGYTVRFWF
ncbi:MAG: leucine-rich repeat domain-containing protein [Treponema sp.]|jgi:hypothetical protein|nr:leucine-rich repeat domain-containing protein [Treponema sp.]